MDETELYKNFIDKNILIKYHGGAYLTGICRSMDGYLNVTVEKANFFEKRGAGAIRLASCFIRGGALHHIELMEDC